MRFGADAAEEGEQVSSEQGDAMNAPASGLAARMRARDPALQPGVRMSVVGLPAADLGAVQPLAAVGETVG